MVTHLIWIGGFVLLLWRFPRILGSLIWGLWQLVMGGYNAMRLLTEKQPVEPTK